MFIEIDNVCDFGVRELDEISILITMDRFVCIYLAGENNIHERGYYSLILHGPPGNDGEAMCLNLLFKTYAKSLAAYNKIREASCLMPLRHLN